MTKHYLLSGALVAVMVSGLGACADDSGPVGPSAAQLQSQSVTANALTGAIRLS